MGTGKSHLPSYEEFIHEVARVPWRGASCSPKLFTPIQELFRYWLKVPSPRHRTYSLTAVIGILNDTFFTKRPRPAGFQREILAYALCLVEQRSSPGNRIVLTAAAFCRTVDALHDSLHVPVAVQQHLRSKLAAQGFGELQPEAAPVVRKLIDTYGTAQTRTN